MAVLFVYIGDFYDVVIAVGIDIYAQSVFIHDLHEGPSPYGRRWFHVVLDGLVTACCDWDPVVARSKLAATICSSRHLLRAGFYDRQQFVGIAILGGIPAWLKPREP